MYYVLLDANNKIIDVVSGVQVRGVISHYFDGTAWQAVPSARLRMLKPGEDVHFGEDVSTVQTIDPPAGLTDVAMLEGAVLELAEMVSMMAMGEQVTPVTGGGIGDGQNQSTPL